MHCTYPTMTLFFYFDFTRKRTGAIKREKQFIYYHFFLMYHAMRTPYYGMFLYIYAMLVLDLFPTYMYLSHSVLISTGCICLWNITIQHIKKRKFQRSSRKYIYKINWYAANIKCFWFKSLSEFDILIPKH